MALRRNILLFHQGALGDFVLTWPIALALARIHPQSRLFYVTQSQKGKLAEKVLGVESLDAEAGWHGLFGAGGELADLPARMLAGAHSVISFVSTPTSPWVANVRAVAPQADVLTINPNPPEQYAGHASAWQLEQLAPWPAAHAAAEQIRRSIQSRGISVARPTPSAGVVVHPGSGSPAKNWPAKRYLELIRRLGAAGETARVIVGEVELEQWPADVMRQFESLAEVKRPATYAELLTELLSARAYVGNDSGPSHLAGILGLPSLVLFGPTDPARWKPLGPRVQTLRAAPLASLDLEVVVETLAAFSE